MSIISRKDTTNSRITQDFFIFIRFCLQSRHCELAKQSRCKSRFLDCFVPRNDESCFPSLRACEAIQVQVKVLDCFAGSQ